MAAVTKAGASAIFDLKSAALTLFALVLKSSDLTLLAQELQQRLGHSPALFDDDAVVIDLTPLRDSAEVIDFHALIELLRSHRMRPLGIKGASDAQKASALEAGLIEVPDGPVPVARTEPEPPVSSAAAAGSATLIVDRPLRSGQQAYARGGDLVVMAAVSFGAEVIADGNVHVYAPLRGRAVAGARGDASARIFTTCMEPQLVAIAGTYRTIDTPLPDDVAGKPAQVRLEGDRLVIEPLKP